MKRTKEKRAPRVGIKKTKYGKHVPRPTHWNDDRIRQVFAIALLGATDNQIADIMGVSVKTVERWKRDKPEFLDALREGKELADANVAHAGYMNAIGFEYEEEQVVKKRDGHEIVTVKKQKLPDSYAIFKWLAIRQRNTWADTKVSVNANLNVDVTKKLDFSKLDEDEMKTLTKLGMKQLMEGSADDAEVIDDE